ncbi:MAG: neutral/alkaline non-lysosomal ceramidase N-terminal domain-containing protein [Eubacteriales bacterium]
MKNLIAGTASYDMSPPEGVRLAGYPHFPRNNTGIHDPLFASCLYLSDGKTEIALITLDILFFSKKYIAQVRDRVNKICGLPKENLLICCSHTHSGPWAAGNPELDATAGSSEDIDPDYLVSLLDGVVSTAVKAKSTAFPAMIGFGTGICGAEKGVGGNRIKKEGICDPSLNVLAVKDEMGRIRGIITNYALHPTFLHEDNTLVTADYPGYLRQTLHKRYPEAVIGFAQGASGDQSSRYFRKGQSFDEAERVGYLMGKTAADVIENMAFENMPEIQIISTEIPLDIKVFAAIGELEENVRKKTDEYNRLKQENASYLEVQEANLRMLGAEDMLGYALCIRNEKRIDLRDDENPAEIQVISIGNHIIAGIPGEIFVEFALRIKTDSDAETVFVFELANGCLPGYCINREAAFSESYESGNSMLTPEFGDKIADTVLDLIRKLK